MSHWLGDRLRVLSPRSGARHQANAVVWNGIPTEVDLAAFTADWRVSGRVLVAAPRLTDLVNASEALAVTDALVVNYGADMGIVVSQLPIPRDELLAVSGVGPRGDPDKRVRTRGHSMMVRIGPYVIYGHLHARPGLDPLVALQTREPMVPLTEARLECEWSGERWVERMAVVIVNRERIDWIGPVRHEDALRPVAMPASDPSRLEVFVDNGLNERLTAYRGKWVAVAAPSQILATAETAGEAFSAGQAAGEAQPTILRVPD